jgi:hypothetical protein
MEWRPLGMDGDAKCNNAKCNNEILRQVRFAAVCDHGHLQDFPWMEWVHREQNPSCKHNESRLYYKAGGSGSLSDISVECKACGKKRNLAGIMSGEMPEQDSSDDKKQRGSSTLSRVLLAADFITGATGGCPEFLCQGGRVWLGEPAGQPGGKCRRPLRAVLINATNVHYAQVESALWIPPMDVGVDISNLRILLDRPAIRNQVKALKTFNLPVLQIAQNLRQTQAALLSSWTEEELVKGLSEGVATQDISWQDGLDEEDVIRFPEYQQLQKARDPLTTEEPLEIREVDIAMLPENLKDVIAGISLVDKLRETRVYRGFNRLVPQHVNGAPSPQSHLWQKAPVVDTEKWLPCSVVFGEGIFIQFKDDCIATWEGQSELTAHLKPLQDREESAARRMGRPPRSVRPRFLLLHTLAHLLIRRLVFECGYGSASLRERLYVSENPKSRMAGILIYTASGDCEGSMGGLVRMGEPENFARIFEAAISDAAWCSADPVCTESGTNGGQGIDGLNIAACHCCTLLPETSCECFNSLLDRSLITSRYPGVNLGFFK